MVRPLTIASVLLLVGLGFSTPALYGEPAHEGGGGGRYFTGSLRDPFGCDVCHDGGAPPMLEPRGVPRRYVPGSTYTFDLAWDEASLSLVGEVVDDDGLGIGALALAPVSILGADERCGGGNPAVRMFEADEGTRTIFAASDCGAQRVRVQWTAPEAAAGPATLHVAAVAGDGAGDVYGDGAQRLRIEIDGPSAPDTGGCTIGGDGIPPPMITVLLVLAHRRRRR